MKLQILLKPSKNLFILSLFASLIVFYLTCFFIYKAVFLFDTFDNIQTLLLNFIIIIIMIKFNIFFFKNLYIVVQNLFHRTIFDIEVDSRTILFSIIHNGKKKVISTFDTCIISKQLSFHKKGGTSRFANRYISVSGIFSEDLKYNEKKIFEFKSLPLYIKDDDIQKIIIFLNKI